MCLIIAKPENIELDFGRIRAAHSNNSDGFGLSFVENDKVKIIKGLFDIGQIEQLIQENIQRQLLIHFRYCTSGGVSEENTHPLKILDEENGKNLVMVHNGILRDVESTESKSDTRIFVEEMLSPLLRSNPDLIYDKKFQDLLKTAIGVGNKLVFMSNYGPIVIINKEAGFEEDTVWYSNRYSLQPSHRANRNVVSTVPFRDVNLNEQKVSGSYYPLITEIRPQSPASKSGIQVGDVLIAMNDKKIESMEQITAMVTAGAGRPITFKIYRSKKSKYVQVTLKPRRLVYKDVESWMIGVYSEGSTEAQRSYWVADSTPVKVVQPRKIRDFSDLELVDSPLIYEPVPFPDNEIACGL